MVFLGFGKYARADRIYALEPIMGEERGNGRRTLVWVEGIPDPIVASRTQETILEEMAEDGDGRLGALQWSRRVRHAYNNTTLLPDLDKLIQYIS